MKKLFTLIFGIFLFASIGITSYAAAGELADPGESSLEIQADTVAPVVLDFLMEFTADESADSVGATFTLTYSEDVQLVDTFVIVTHAYTNGTWDEYDRYTLEEIAIDGNVITVTPERSFWASGRYEFIVTSGAVQDMAGNTAGSFTRTFVADEGAPEATDYDIQLTFNETNDSVNAVFTITYSENIQLEDTFQIVTHAPTNGTWEEYDRYTQEEITINGNVLTISPERMFSASSRYELIVTFGSITDLAGNIATSFTRVFVADATPPEVTDLGTEFTDTQFDDSLNVSFTLTYNEDVQLAPTYKFLTYQQGADGWEEYEVLADADITVTGDTIVLHPQRLISSNNSYELVVTAGSVRDIAGNPATSFTKIFLLDTIRPKLIDISPDLTVPVALDAIYTFTFDEEVRLAENFGFYTYYWDEDSAKYIEYEKLEAAEAMVENNVVTFNPSRLFRRDQQAQIVLTAGSVLDIEGNGFLNVVGDDTLTYVSERFWTVDTAGTVVSFQPGEGDSLSYTPDALTIAFSENILLVDSLVVDTLSLDSLVYLRQGGTDLDHQASFDSIQNVITIVPAEPLPFGAAYTFGFNDGFINEAGDSLAAREATFVIRDSADIVNEVAIAEINAGETASPLLGQKVKITATVTGVYPDEGFFVQDDNAAGSGIWVEYTDTSTLETGDGVMVTGMVQEMDGLTLLVAEEVMETDAPIMVEPLVFNFTTDSLQMYQGVLVKIEDAMASAVDTAGEWMLYSQDGMDSVIVSSQIYAYTPVADNLYDLTGVVSLREGVYRIEPRTEADIVDITTDVDLLPEVDLRIYPNPFVNYIRINNADKVSRLIISNIAGQRVVDVNRPQHEINTSHLVSGVYIISLFNEKELIKTSRIIKH